MSGNAQAHEDEPGQGELSYGDGYWVHMFIALALFGLGIGTTFTPMTLTATAGIPPAEAGLAAGLVNTSRQVGGAVGQAVLATLAASATRDSSAVRSAADALTAGYDRAFASLEPFSHSHTWRSVRSAGSPMIALTEVCTEVFTLAV